MELRCTTCKNDISTIKGSTEFKCPECGEVDIFRCGKCRSSAKQWKCSNCSFEGP
ncbi:MAG: RNA-binding protein [Candidatus Altiarchaeota archaeon]|nr:RNA-binding protein [Candidatus Altiarchaeota archaeon]